jgi:ribosome-associated translation inhibitor RaiA
MASSYQRNNLRIVLLGANNREISADALAKMEKSLDPLRRAVRDFPVADLYISTSFHRHSGTFHVKTSLVLSGRTLFTGERNEHLHPAFERCVHKLVKKLEAYLASLKAKPEIAKNRKGTHQEVVPVGQPDAESLEGAVRAGDYAAFRQATYVYEEPVRKRVGRWIQRYPGLLAQLGTKLTVDDLVEEVFLTAFDRFDQVPRSMRLGDWLERLLDPSVKALLRDLDGEKENIEFARTIQGVQKGI